jgi:hypothetical protein
MKDFRRQLGSGSGTGRIQKDGSVLFVQHNETNTDPAHNKEFTKKNGY